MAYDSENSLKIYLREISKTPLLTAAEEMALAERIRAGDKLARTKMIEANLRLVVKIAHDYAGYGMSLADLVSDIGAGGGYYTVRLSPLVGPKGRVLAEDIVPATRDNLARRVQHEAAAVHTGDVQAVTI